MHHLVVPSSTLFILYAVYQLRSRVPDSYNRTEQAPTLTYWIINRNANARGTIKISIDLPWKLNTAILNDRIFSSGVRARSLCVHLPRQYNRNHINDSKSRGVSLRYATRCGIVVTSTCTVNRNNVWLTRLVKHGPAGERIRISLHNAIGRGYMRVRRLSCIHAVRKARFARPVIRDNMLFRILCTTYMSNEWFIFYFYISFQFYIYRSFASKIVIFLVDWRKGERERERERERTDT